LHPAKIATFLEKLIRKREEKEKNIFQKNFSKHLPVKKRIATFAAANREVNEE
jgi:hypothetical protein